MPDGRWMDAGWMLDGCWMDAGWTPDRRVCGTAARASVAPGERGCDVASYAPRSRRRDGQAASMVARIAQRHGGVQHPLGPVRCCLGAAAVGREQVAAAGEVLISRAARLCRHGDPDALLARVAAQLGEALAAPPFEAGAPVARRLLAV